jgi:hypothetical protein
LVSSSANQRSVFRFSPGTSWYSEKLVIGTTQRLSTPSQRRQWGEETLRTLRMLVTPESDFRPSRNLGGVGIPHLAEASSRWPSVPTRTIGAE